MLVKEATGNISTTKHRKTKVRAYFMIFRMLLVLRFLCTLSSYSEACYTSPSCLRGNFRTCAVYLNEYAHGIVVSCFVLAISQFFVDSCDQSAHVLRWVGDASPLLGQSYHYLRVGEITPRVFAKLTTTSAQRDKPKRQTCILLQGPLLQTWFNFNPSVNK